MKSTPLFPQPQTLAQQVTQILRRGLTEGRWKDFLPGEVELSRSLQVSRMTLRASLAALTTEGLFTASRGRKRRIVRPTAARGIPAKNRLFVLLTAVPIEMMTTLHLLQVEGLRELFGRAGFVLEVQVSPGVFSGQPRRALERLILSRPAAAWILLNSSAPMQHWFMERQLPCVIIGAAHEGVTTPSLGTDYPAIGRHAAGMFLRRGHRDLVFIVPGDGKAGHAHTEAGFRAGAALLPGTSVQVIRHQGQPDAIVRSVTHLLKYSPATGFLVAMPPFVLSVLSAFSAAGAAVPQRLSLISRDSDRYLDFVRPSIARYVINVPAYVKKIFQATLLVSRGSVPRVRAQLLPRDFVEGDTLGNVSAM